jgi:hypothetical protein
MGRWRGGVQVAAGRRELPAERGEAGCGLSAWRDAGRSGGERYAGWAGRVKGRERRRTGLGSGEVLGPRRRERGTWAEVGLTWVGFWLGFGLSGFWLWVWV